MAEHRSNALVGISSSVTVQVDLARIRSNAESIRSAVRVPLLAVVKADAYGLGASQVVQSLATLAAGFCFFSLAEAVAAEAWKRSGKPSLILGPSPEADAEEYLLHRARPAVWTAERAAALRAARPVLSVDTGMQRFACPPDQVQAVIEAGGCDEAFTHATRMEQTHLLLQRAGNRGLRLHAAGTSLLHEPLAWLDAVRPGLALYRGAVRAATTLVDVRDTLGPAGYTRFEAGRHGIILAGYAHGLRKGPCLVNGRLSRIIEVGMQSAYVEASSNDKPGDEVVLLSDLLTEIELSAAWGSSPQEVLVRMSGMGQRAYLNPLE